MIKIVQKNQMNITMEVMVQMVEGISKITINSGINVMGNDLDAFDNILKNAQMYFFNYFQLGIVEIQVKCKIKVLLYIQMVLLLIMVLYVKWMTQKIKLLLNQ